MPSLNQLLCIQRERRYNFGSFYVFSASKHGALLPSLRDTKRGKRYVLGRTLQSLAVSCNWYGSRHFFALFQPFNRYDWPFHLFGVKIMMQVDFLIYWRIPLQLKNVFLLYCHSFFSISGNLQREEKEEEEERRIHAPASEGGKKLRRRRDGNWGIPQEELKNFSIRGW